LPVSRCYTIGHSTHELGQFIELLRGAGVRCVADVRTMPRSRTNPQFNTDVLPAALAAHGIGYEHVAALGGLRSRQRSVAEDTNAYWDNASFHNYADYAMSEAFAAGLARLRELAAQAPTALMCAEALWWRCHRRIIADYLIAGGEPVIHILADGSLMEARLTPAARRAGAVLVYPRSA
jgi:uncharacterized protein (DUF488 family)